MNAINNKEFLGNSLTRLSHIHIDKPDNLLNFKWTHTILAIPLDRPIFINDVISMLKEIFTAMYK